MDTVDPVDSVVVKPLLRGWSHVLAFTVVAVLGIIMASVAGASLSERMWLIVYVAGTLTMFGVSSLYHCLRWRDRGHSIMRRLDHSAIFLAIAGAYTPIMAVALDGWQKIVVLCAAWGGAIVGVSMEWLPVRVPRPLFTAVYVVVGWSASVAFPELLRNLGGVGFALVLGGGVLYTVGAVVYGFKWPNPWPRVFGFHEIFHLFTIAGAGCHLAAIAFYVVPLM